MVVDAAATHFSQGNGCCTASSRVRHRCSTVPPSFPHSFTGRLQEPSFVGGFLGSPHSLNPSEEIDVVDLSLEVVEFEMGVEVDQTG